MAIIEENWLVIGLVTVLSLGLHCYLGIRGRRFIWLLCGTLAALILAAVSQQLGWANVGTASFAYGILIVYCPLMWLLVVRKDEGDTNPASQPGQ